MMRRRLGLVHHWMMGERSQMGHDEEETWPGCHHWMMGERSQMGYDEEET